MSNNRMYRFLRSLVLLFLFCAGFAPAQAQGGPSPHDFWYTLERGKLMFRQGDYGNALMAFDDARRQRQAMFAQLEQNLITVLSITEVRRLGDTLEFVERYIADHRYDDAADALTQLYYRIPREQFNNSVTAALKALGDLRDYPEAEYWIGETYLKEGELNLAINQFQKALAMRQLHENPGFAVELQYKIAAIHYVRQEYNEMERVLLAILENDSLWSGITGTYARRSMTRALETNGINRFLVLYRYSHIESLEAHRLLGIYYYNSGRHSKAQEHLMFAFLIQNTIIIDEITRQRYDFSFTTLNALAREMNGKPVLMDYAEKTEYFKTAYYLGASLYSNGKTGPARDIWNFLAAQPNAGEWQNRAIAQLRNPRVGE